MEKALLIGLAGAGICFSIMVFCWLAKSIKPAPKKKRNIPKGYKFRKRRGGWRKLSAPDAIGKNEAGEYCELGRTWVNGINEGD